MANNPFDQFDAPAAAESSGNPFDQFDGATQAQAAPAEQPDTRRVGDLGSAIMEPLGAIGSNMLAVPVAGLAGLGAAGTRALGLTDADPADVVRSVQGAMTYQPSTQAGEAVTRAVSYPFEKLAQLGDFLGQKTADRFGPGAGAAVNTATQFAPSLLFPALKGRAKPAEVAPNVARTAPVDQPVAAGQAAPVPAVAQAAERPAGLASVPAAAEKSSAQVAREAGFVLKPSEAGGKAGAIAEGLSGSAKLETAAIIKNSKRADQLAAEEIGVKELKGGALAKAREPHSAVYKEVGTLGEVPAGPEYAAEIGNIGRAPGNSFAKAINSEVEQLKQQYTVERFDAKDAVLETRELRFKARKNLKSQDPAKNELGAAQLKVSDAIENQLERQAAASGKGDLVARFKRARIGLAKINSVVGAMRNGRISPEILAKQLDAGVPLSGNLRVIAQVAKDYPNVMRNASKVKGQSPVNMFETAVGLGGAAAVNPAFLGAMVARPLTRAALLSERYQRGLSKPTPARNALAEEAPKQKQRNALLEY